MGCSGSTLLQSIEEPVPVPPSSSPVPWSAAMGLWLDSGSKGQAFAVDSWTNDIFIYLVLAICRGDVVGPGGIGTVMGGRKKIDRKGKYVTIVSDAPPSPLHYASMVCSGQFTTGCVSPVPPSDASRCTGACCCIPALKEPGRWTHQSNSCAHHGAARPGLLPDPSRPFLW